MAYLMLRRLVNGYRHAGPGKAGPYSKNLHRRCGLNGLRTQALLLAAAHLKLTPTARTMTGGQSMERSTIQKRKKILLIDDDEWIRDAMAAFFESEGSAFVALETAEDGIAEVARRDYDVIISDYRLPGMDGLSFFRHIADRASGAIKLLITAYGTETLPAEARWAGVHGYITKPFDMQDIEAVLARLMQDRSPKRPKPVETGAR